MAETYNPNPNPDFGKDEYEVSVIKLNPDQWQEYRALRVKALEEEPVAFEDPVEGMRRFEQRTEAEWRGMLEGKPSGGKPGQLLVLLAEHGHELVGGINAIITEAENAKEAFIQNVYAIKQARGKGVGKRLMAALLEEFRKIENVKKAKLDVFATQEAAVGLYKSFGFEVVEHIQNAKMYDGKQIDEYKMEKILSE